MKSTIVFFALFILVFIGCGKEENALPIIHLFQASPNSVEVGGEVTITVLATDDDGDILTYVYQTGTGTINGTGATVKWIAPDIPGKYSVKVNVSDGKEFAISSVDITVTEKQKPETDGLIVPGKQVAGIKMGDSLDDIESIYGVGEKEYEDTYFFSSYQDYGLVIVFDDRDRVDGILLFKPNKSKTAGGNGIGSTAVGVKTEFGEPEEIIETEYWYYTEGIAFIHDDNSKVTGILIFYPE